MKKALKILVWPILVIAVVLVAVFVFISPNNKQDIEFMVNGQTYEVVEYKEGESIEIDEPVVEGYLFEGWFSNEDCKEDDRVDFSNFVYEKNMKLYAKMTAIDYDIVYNLNGGSFEGAPHLLIILLL